MLHKQQHKIHFSHKAAVKRYKVAKGTAAHAAVPLAFPDSEFLFNCYDGCETAYEQRQYLRRGSEASAGSCRSVIIVIVVSVVFVIVVVIVSFGKEVVEITVTVSGSN